MLKSVGIIVTLTAAAAPATGCSGKQQRFQRCEFGRWRPPVQPPPRRSLPHPAHPVRCRRVPDHSCATPTKRGQAQQEAQTGGTVTVGEAQAAGANISAKLDAVKQNAGPISRPSSLVCRALRTPTCRPCRGSRPTPPEPGVPASPGCRPGRVEGLPGRGHRTQVHN